MYKYIIDLRLSYLYTCTSPHFEKFDKWDWVELKRGIMGGIPRIIQHKFDEVDRLIGSTPSCCPSINPCLARPVDLLAVVSYRRLTTYNKAGILHILDTSSCPKTSP